jgi:hypothetical protein
MNYGTFTFLEGDAQTIVTGLLTWFLTILGVLAVVYFVYGGVLYMTAGADSEKAGKGRTVIVNAIIGIIIIVASFVIVQLVARALAAA